MKYINHITLNTGHTRNSYPNEVSKELYFILKRLQKELLSENGAEIIDGYRAEGKYAKGHGLLITLYSKNKIPILTSIVVNENDDDFLWKLLHEHSTTPLKTKATNPPKKPYIADKIEIGAIAHMDAMEWTGDFSKCIGWMYVDENAIRG